MGLILDELLACHQRPYTHTGICAHLSFDNSIMFRSMALCWPKYSGNIAFPVPHPTLDPKNGYFDAEHRFKLWDHKTTYGQNRWELLEFCINHCQEAQRNAQ